MLISLKITRDTFISGTPVFAGEEVEVEPAIARLLLDGNKAARLENSPLPAEPVKPSFRKKAKASE